MTLPRRHHRRNLSSESTFLISSRDCSPIRRRSPAICYGGSLPRSTHSIPGRSPKRTPLNKQIIDEKNRALAKSGEIYQNKSAISNQGTEREPVQQNQRFPPSRNQYSGPSSLESGKASSSLAASGPSSIDSGNKSLSLSRNSGHSSLDSHGSVSTVATNSQSQTGTMHNSPKSSPKHRALKSSGTSTPKVTTSTSTNGVKSTSFDDSAEHNQAMGMPSSNSNGSITLQVTNNNNGSMLPNTKIYVQNSPVRTSITFENGKLLENSNVFIINNETTTNAKGETIANRKTIINNPPASPLKQQNQQIGKRPLEKQRSLGVGKENYFSENEEVASETGDSLSMISETSPDSSFIPYADEEDENDVHVQNGEIQKFTKTFKNDTSMNNRKLSLQIGSPTTANVGQTSNGQNGKLVYNNMLKNHYNQQTNAIISPVIQNNHKMNLFSYDQNQQSLHNQHANNVGSMGHLGNLNLDKKINSNCDLKNLLLNSNPTINSDSLLNIFHKNIITVGSEPNLITINKQSDNKQKFLNCLKNSQDNSPDDSLNAKTPTFGDNNHMTSNGQLYNFPSLTDLSFNFTSLHAQKILKGGKGSINNSIDTLVELDINKPNNHRSNSNLSPSTTVCTDLGMV